MSGIGSISSSGASSLASRAAWKELNNRIGVVIYPYTAKGKYQLSMNAGDVLEVKAESNGWFKCSLHPKCVNHSPNSRTFGIFPSNYVSLLESNEFPKDPRAIVEAELAKVMKKIEQKKNETDNSELDKVDFGLTDMFTLSNDPVIIEILQVLREWATELKKFLEENRQAEYDRVKKKMQALVAFKKQLMNLNSNQERLREDIEKKVIQLIEEGSRMLNLDVIVRVKKGENKGARANEHNTSVVSLYNMYRDIQRKEEELHERLEKLEAGKKAKLIHKATRVTNKKLLRKSGNDFVAQKAEEEEDTHNTPEGISHLLLDLKASIFTVGEPTEIFFSLYDSKNKVTITEEYKVALTSLGMPKDERLIGNMTTLFKDITAKDWKKNLWLVCKIYRKGKIILEASDKVPSTSAWLNNTKATEKEGYRRPFGCSVINLSPAVVAEHLMSEEEWKPGKLPIYCTKEGDFHNLQNKLIEGDFKDVELVPATRAIGVAIGLTLIPGEFNEVINRFPIAKKCCKTKMLGFPEVISPSDIRNDLYVTLEGGQFSDSRNVEINVQVKLHGNDTVAQKCITRNSSLFEQPENVFRSFVMYHVHNPIWNETIRVDLPAADMEKAILIFTFGHCSNKRSQFEKFGLGYLELMTNRNVLIEDKQHTIQIFRYQKGLEDQITNLIQNQALRTKLSTKNTFNVTTKLVSTRMTQNESLNHLLKWREIQGRGDINMERVLESFTFIAMEELVKFLREILEALFTIFAESNDEKIIILAYKVLLFLVGTVVSQKQFENYRQIMDEYIEKHMTSVRAYSRLLKCINVYLDAPTNDTTASKQLAESMKALNFLMKFIVKSREQYLEARKRDPSNTPDDGFPFEETVYQTITKVNQIMPKKEQGLVAAQSMLLKYMGELWDSVARVFRGKKLGQLVRQFIDSIPVTTDKRKNFTEGKLQALKNIISGLVFKDEEARRHLLPSIVRDLAIHFNRNSNERSLCIAVLGKLCSSIQKGLIKRHEDESVVKQAFSVTLICVPDMFEALKVLGRDKQDSINLLGKKKAALTEEQTKLEAKGDAVTEKEADDYHKHATEVAEIEARLKQIEESKAELLASILCIFHVMDEAMLAKFLEIDSSITDDSPSATSAMPGGKTSALTAMLMKRSNKALLEQSLYRLMELLVLMIKDNPIPEHWISFNSFQLFTMKRIIMYITSYMLQHFRGQREFNFSLWDQLFTIMIEFITHKRLQLEEFTLSKSNKILGAYEDMRLHMVTFMLNTWTQLETHQKLFIPKLVEPILSMMFTIKKEAINKVCFELYYSFLKREFTEEKKLAKCEGVTASVLDKYVNLGIVSDDFQNSLFYTLLAKKFNEDADLKEVGKEFMHRIKQLVTLVVGVQKYSDDEEDQKSSALLTVMHYLKSNNDLQLYFRYVQILCKMHIHLKNYVEAGMCLMVHAEKLSWREDVKVPKLEVGVVPFPEESEKERKEKLYNKAISLFMDPVYGKDWERATGMLRELCRVYEFETFEYRKLAECHKLLGECYSQIISTNRFFASYFYVAFYGKGFEDMGIRDKKFIYRGCEVERNVDFIKRIKKLFPNAEILKPKAAPTNEQRNGVGQYIQIDTVIPSSIEEMKSQKAQRGRLPFKVYRYNNNNNINVFLVTRTYRSSDEKTDNQYKDMYTDITFYVVKEPYPTIQRRMEIIEEKTITLSPIENAIKNIEDKNPELEELVIQHHEEPKPDTLKLSMLLNGVIDAAVNGGIKLYIDAFFTEEYIKSHPENAHLVRKFQKVLADQLRVLGEGLVMRRKFVTGAALGLSDHLEKLHVKMQEELKEPLSLNVDAVIRGEKQIKSRDGDKDRDGDGSGGGGGGGNDDGDSNAVSSSSSGDEFAKQVRMMNYAHRLLSNSAVGQRRASERVEAGVASAPSATTTTAAAAAATPRSPTLSGAPAPAPAPAPSPRGSIVGSGATDIPPASPRTPRSPPRSPTLSAAAAAAAAGAPPPPASPTRTLPPVPPRKNTNR